MSTRRIARYVAEYAPSEARPSAEELRTADVRADRWSDAHVEGGCTCGLSPLECGERMAASEIVECR